MLDRGLHDRGLLCTLSCLVRRQEFGRQVDADRDGLIDLPELAVALAEFGPVWLRVSVLQCISGCTELPTAVGAATHQSTRSGGGDRRGQGRQLTGC